MAFIAADSYSSTIASIAGGTGITSFTVTSASGFPAIGNNIGHFTVVRIDDLGTPEDVVCIGINGTTVTCLATGTAHANGNTIDAAIWTNGAMAQEKDDAISGFPVTAHTGAGALVKGTGTRNHITISATATMTLANGTYLGECCRISMDRTSTAQATVDPASTTTWDGALTIALFAGDAIIGTWDGTGWITLEKYSSFATPYQNFIANNFYALISSNTATTAVGSSTVTRYTPFFVPYPITISQLGARIIGTNAGNFAMAIYANGTNNQPTGAALQSTGSLSCASAATVMGTLGANLQLTPGWYWSALQVDNAVATFMAVSIAHDWPAFSVGVATAADLLCTANGQPYWTATTTFGTFGSSPTITEANTAVANHHMPLIKVASVP